jgi:hypothetical protein
VEVIAARPEYRIYRTTLQQLLAVAARTDETLYLGDVN